MFLNRRSTFLLFYAFQGRLAASTTLLEAFRAFLKNNFRLSAIFYFCE